MGSSSARRPSDDDEDDDLPEGVDASEVEEARMLEAALLGVPYQGRMPDFSKTRSDQLAGGATVLPAKSPSHCIQRSMIITAWHSPPVFALSSLFNFLTQESLSHAGPPSLPSLWTLRSGSNAA